MISPTICSTHILHVRTNLAREVRFKFVPEIQVLFQKNIVGEIIVKSLICVYISLSIYIYIHISHMCTHIYIYIYV